MSEKWSGRGIGTHLNALDGGYGTRRESASIIRQLLADLAAARKEIDDLRNCLSNATNTCQRLDDGPLKPNSTFNHNYFETERHEDG